MKYVGTYDFTMVSNGERMGPANKDYPEISHHKTNQTLFSTAKLIDGVSHIL